MPCSFEPKYEMSIIRTLFAFSLKFCAFGASNIVMPASAGIYEPVRINDVKGQMLSLLKCPFVTIDSEDYEPLVDRCLRSDDGSENITFSTSCSGSDI